MLSLQICLAFGHDRTRATKLRQCHSLKNNQAKNALFNFKAQREGEKQPCKTKLWLF